jgi:hypothetical protein
MLQVPAVATVPNGSLLVFAMAMPVSYPDSLVTKGKRKATGFAELRG